MNNIKLTKTSETKWFSSYDNTTNLTTDKFLNELQPTTTLNILMQYVDTTHVALYGVLKKIGLYNINKHLSNLLKTNTLSNEEIVVVLNETQTIEKIISIIQQFLEDNDKHLKKILTFYFTKKN